MEKSDFSTDQDLAPVGQLSQWDGTRATAIYRRQTGGRKTVWHSEADGESKESQS